MQILIGTSGWMYKDWTGRFYPKTLADRDKLRYYTRHFPTVEINSSFYHLPTEKSVQNWHQLTPDDFSFAVKLSRYCTHTKRLVPDEDFDESLHEFFKRIRHLKDKLGVVLVQLPASQRADQTRIEHLAEQVKQLGQEFGQRFPLAIEFRHKSWFTAEIFDCLRHYKIANVNISSPDRWAASREVSPDLAYIRFHGSQKLYWSSYSDSELTEWAQFIKKECAGCRRVYVYFNNDHQAVAVHNALSLMRILKL